MPWAPTCGCDPARSWVHAPADLGAPGAGGTVISVLQELNELRAVKIEGFPRSEHWTAERWREVTGSRYPIVRIGEGFLAMADDEPTAKVAEIPASPVLEFAEHVATWPSGPGSISRLWRR